MRALSASKLLDCWERGVAQSPVRRALTLLDAACPDITIDDLAELSIGQRDNCLLTLREWTFGPHLVCLTTCPECSERLELTFNVSDIRVDPETEPIEAFSLSNAGYEIRFRLPNSLDMEALADNKDLNSSRDLLLKHCILEASFEDEEASIEQLPANIVNAIVKRMAQADPQADVQLDLSCFSCGHQWQAVFDIVSFFWSEINAWVRRVVREVHILASAYGWREADILAMSSWRRQMYLEMVRG